MKRTTIVTFLSLLALALVLVAVGAPTSAHEPLDTPPIDSVWPGVAATTAISRTPIIFIHGIMGSRLFNTINYNEHEIWADFEHILRSDLDMLLLAPDGVSPASDDPSYTTVHIKPGTAGVVANLHVPIFGYDYPVYQDLLNHFLQASPAGLGYTEGVDFWAYPYDWRKDNRLAADALDVLVNQILTQTGQSHVYIVAHSMGGVVSRQYISNPARAAKVKRLITLGTPYLGTPKAYFVLLEGDCILDVTDMLHLPVKDVFCFPSMAEAQKIVVNYPGFYELFASRAYFDVKGSGYYSVDKSDPSAPCPQCLSYTQTYTTAVASNLNTAILASSDAFHQAIDTMGDWANPWNNVPVDMVAGIGQQTVVGIRQQTKWPCGCPWCVCGHAPVYSAQGDGTVALYSASMANPSNGVNLRGTASYTTFVGDHTGLTQMPTVWNYIDQRLGLTTTTSLAVQAAADAAPAQFTGAQVIAFGAAAIQTYDAVGRYTGLLTGTELIVHSIPGSAYHHREGLASVALLGGQAYTITVIPSGNSLVDLTLLQTTVSSAVTTTLHTGLSVTAQSRIHLFGDPFQADTWHIDVDGDGDINQSHTPTLIYAHDDVQDTLPPTTTINVQGTLGPQGWYTAPVTVTITGADNVGGSDLSRVEYMFKGDARPRPYSGPFVADPAQVSVLYVVSTDRAGNMHEPIQVRLGPEKIYLPIVQTPCREYCVGWAVGNAADGYGVVLRTDDSGVTWTRQGQVGAIPDVNMNGVSAVDAQNAWVVGGQTILRTRDGGLTWEQQALPGDLPADFELFQVKALDAHAAFAVGGSGVLLQTTDGTTWTKMPTSPDLPLIQYSDVDTADVTHVWAVGGVLSGTNPRNGLAVAFYDGVQWQWQGNNITGSCAAAPVLIGLSVVDQDTAWAVGGEGCPPFKTMNGGATWQAMGGPLDTQDTNRVVAVTRDLVWITGDNHIHRTTNGGGDWAATDAGCGGYNYCYAISAARTKYAWASDVSGWPPRGNLYRTVDGEHWEAQAVPPDSSIWIISFVGARR